MADNVRSLKVELTANTEAFQKQFASAAESAGRLRTRLKELADTQATAGRSTTAANDAFGRTNQKLGELADTAGRTATKLARSADAFGLAAGPLRALDDVMDVAELGFGNLSKAAAGFNAASIGVAGAGLAIGAAIGGMLRQIPAVAEAADKAAASLYRLFHPEVDNVGSGTQGLAAFTARMAASNEEAIRKQVAQLRQQGVAVDDIAKMYKGRLSPALAESLGLSEKQVDAWKKGRAEAEAAAKAFAKLVDDLSGKSAQEEVDLLAQAFERLGVNGVADLEALRKKLEQLQQSGAKVSGGLLAVLKGGKVDIPAPVGELDLGVSGGPDPAQLAAVLRGVGGRTQADFNALAVSAAKAGAASEIIAAQLEKAGASADEIAVALRQIPGPAAIGLGSALKTAFAGLPQVILSAFQGGGDVGKSIGSYLGGSILGSLTGENGALGKGLKDVLGKTLGGALGSILPGLGSILGSGLGSLLGKAAGALGKLFGGGEEKQVNKLRDSFIAAHGGWEALQKSIAKATKEDLLKKLFDAKTVKQYEAALDEITRKLGLMDEAQTAVDDAMQRYGIEASKAGGALAKAALDEQAQQLYKDWSVLQAKGADMVYVGEKMADSVNEYVNAALAAGQSVPESMRPMLETMLKNGQLLDANGQAFGSLEEAGVTFAKTQGEMWDTLIKKVDELVSALLGIPPSVPVDVPVNVHYPNGKPEIPGGGAVDIPGGDTDAIPRLARGGIVTRPTLAIVGEAGAEAIIPLNRGRGVGQSSSVTNINVHADPFQTAESRRDMERRLWQSVEKRRVRSLALNVAGGFA